MDSSERGLMNEQFVAQSTKAADRKTKSKLLGGVKHIILPKLLLGIFVLFQSL